MKLKYFIFLLIPVFLYSCSSKQESAYENGEMNQQYTKDNFYAGSSTVPDVTESATKSAVVSSTSPEYPDGTKAVEIQEAVMEKQIIKTANINFAVEDYKNSISKIKSVIQSQNGFIASENENKDNYRVYNTLVIKVEKDKFDSLLSMLEGNADKLESKTINTQDVTEEYVDILKRLENKKKVEAQYLELLKKANSITEILQVNEHIRVIREEIEAKEGRLNYLKNQVGFSTITLYVHQDFDTVSYGFIHKISKGFANGWQGFLVFIIGIITIWPLLLIAAIIFFIIRRIVRKKSNRKNA